MFRVFLLSTLTSLIASAGIGIVFFLVGDFSDTQVKLLLTALAVWAFSLTGLANTIRGGSPWFWALRPMGAGVSLVALLLVVLRIWEVLGDERAAWQAIGTATTLAVSLAHISLLGLFRPRTNVERLWRGGAVLAATMLAAMIVAALYRIFPDPEGEMYLRLLGVVAILDVLGTIGLAPLSRLSAGSRRPIRNPAPRVRPGKSRKISTRGRRPVPFRGR